MKKPFDYVGTHHCEAAVLSCIDFRFWQTIDEYVKTHLGIASYDFPSLPGAAKAINDSEGDLAMSCITIPCQLHNAHKLIIVNHADCGAYGGAKQHADIEAEQEFHAAELRKARAKVLDKHPDKEVILLFAKLVDEGQTIHIVVID